jgi:hypothetical protein
MSLIVVVSIENVRCALLFVFLLFPRSHGLTLHLSTADRGSNDCTHPPGFPLSVIASHLLADSPVCLHDPRLTGPAAASFVCFLNRSLP